MANTKLLDGATCSDSAALVEALQRLGQGLWFERPIHVMLIEKTLSDGSKIESIKIKEV